MDSGDKTQQSTTIALKECGNMNQVRNVPQAKKAQQPKIQKYSKHGQSSIRCAVQFIWLRNNWNNSSFLIL